MAQQEPRHPYESGARPARLAESDLPPAFCDCQKPLVASSAKPASKPLCAASSTAVMPCERIVASAFAAARTLIKASDLAPTA